MKKSYVLILGMLLVVLGMSFVSAADDGGPVCADESDVSISCDEDFPDVMGQADSGEDTALASEDWTTSGEKTPTHYSATKKQRTFKMGKFKATVTKKQFFCLLDIWNHKKAFYGFNHYLDYDVGDRYHQYRLGEHGLYCHVVKKTDRFVKVKVVRGDTVVYKKARVYVNVLSYEGASGDKYISYLSHKYGDSEVSGRNAKYFGICKVASNLYKLNKSKIRNIDKYMKYLSQ